MGVGAGGIYGVGDKIVHSMVVFKISKKYLSEISLNHGVFKMGGVFNTNTSILIFPEMKTSVKWL